MDIYRITLRDLALTRKLGLVKILLISKMR